MAPTVSQLGPDLDVVLERAKETGCFEFTGDDIIHGHVIRKSPLVDPDTSIDIRLHGRSEFRLRATSGMSSTGLSSHFKFFDESKNGLQIHQGPLHISSDGSGHGTWPFAILLPKHPDLAALRSDPSEKTFCPLSDIALQEIPPSFLVKEKSHGRLLEGLVEYYLEVTMRCSGTRSTLTSTKNKEFTAIKLLSVRSGVSPAPITDFGIKKHSKLKRKVASQRLAPGGESRLSIGQHIQKVLGSSQVPVYAFSLEVQVPTVLQIGNPNPIPLRIRAETSWADTNEILRNMTPMILVKNLTMKLQTTCFCSSKKLKLKKNKERGMPAKSSLTLVQYSWTSDSRAVYDTAKTTVATGLDEPSGANSHIVPQDSTTDLDLGVALGILTPKKSGNEKIYPTFTTCNIRNTHDLEWWITLIIGGETVKYNGHHSVTVIGPA
ncbi:hypothetical protein N7492_010030 [Penicillium capsulatum]|uniref:Arrestin-like N-terminal domain-containing protein n=1 Tax=Penicillium capsulatum TaxID=69766 RepID=A0A9W9HN84_9EURO|nr:hypothetical protein N7492_010030 [Penicillium capsulatum]KAJ6112538.1 hypothetical protein N7512_007862 [Penicillium capsulatum]